MCDVMDSGGLVCFDLIPSLLAPRRAGCVPISELYRMCFPSLWQAGLWHLRCDPLPIEEYRS